MNNLPKFAIAAAAALVSGLASASTISLTGTLRDIDVTHPDFERSSYSSETGLVEDGLGSDGTPVYHGGTNLTSAAYFADWFSTPSHSELVSGEQLLTLTLDNSFNADPNVYTYANNSFFPLDGALGGNQGYAHNYHFTFRLSTEFTYQGGETFNFAGDDDVWVFINGQLVVDLGGVHPVEYGFVDLDSVALSLGMTTGNDYSFDLFFAERHTSESNFRIDTSIQLKPTQTDAPEPATLALLGMGLLGLGAARRKAKARA